MFSLICAEGLSKQSIHRWFKTLSRSLWRHCNGFWIINSGNLANMPKNKAEINRYFHNHNLVWNLLFFIQIMDKWLIPIHLYGSNYLSISYSRGWLSYTVCSTTCLGVMCGFPHNGPVKQNAFPCHAAFMTSPHHLILRNIDTVLWWSGVWEWEAYVWALLPHNHRTPAWIVSHTFFLMNASHFRQGYNISIRQYLRGIERHFNCVVQNQSPSFAKFCGSAFLEVKETCQLK